MHHKDVKTTLELYIAVQIRLHQKDVNISAAPRKRQLHIAPRKRQGTTLCISSVFEKYSHISISSSRIIHVETIVSVGSSWRTVEHLGGIVEDSHLYGTR